MQLGIQIEFGWAASLTTYLTKDALPRFPSYLEVQWHRSNSKLRIFQNQIKLQNKSANLNMTLLPEICLFPYKQSHVRLFHKSFTQKIICLASVMKLVELCNTCISILKCFQSESRIAGSPCFCNLGKSCVVQSKALSKCFISLGQQALSFVSTKTDPARIV